MTRLRKRLWKIAIAIVAVLALYPIAANIFLSTPLFDAVVNAHKEDGWVQYERAWSVWPGRVHVKGFWLRARDSNMEFHLRVDEAAFDLSFAALFKAQSVHMSNIDARGVSFRMRQRISAPQGVPEIVDALPPIPGCERIPFVPEEIVDHRDKWDDAFYKLWTVDLSNVVAHDVREVWVDSVRYTGLTTLRGDFYFKPLRRMRIGPMNLDAKDGAVSMMQRQVASGITGSARLVIDEIDPRHGGDGKLVHSMSLEVNGRAQMPDLAALPPRFVEEGMLRGFVDAPKVSVKVDHGIFTEGSHVELVVPELAVNAADHEWRTLVGATIDVVRDAADPNPRFAIHADAKDLVARSTSKARPHEITGGHAVVDVGAHGVDLTELVTDLRVGTRIDLLALNVAKAHAGEIASVVLDASVPELRPKTAEAERPPTRASVDVTVNGGKVDDGHALVRLIDPGAEVRIDASRGGRFDTRAHAEVEGKVVRGTANTRLRGLGIATKKIAVTGDVDVRADVARLDLAKRRLSLRPSTVVAEHVEVRDGSARASRPFVSADRVAFDGAAKDVDLSAPSLAGVDLHVVVAGAAVPDLARMNAMLPPETDMAFESGAARASADVRLSSTERHGTGKIAVALTQSTMRLEKMQVTGGADVAIDIHAFDPSTGVVDLSGSKVTMRDVSVRGASAETTYWNGAVDLVGGKLRFAGGPRLEGTVQLHADDAAPILALAMRDDLPGFLVGPMRAEGLSGQAKLAVGGGSLAVTDLHVRGGTLVVRGDYVKRQTGARGAFVVEKGPLSAGIKMDDEGTFVRLFGLDSWVKAEKQAVAEEKAKAEADANAREREAKAKH